ncbi:DUF2235 domain-containing protein [Photobacterium sp. 53610]|uniref:DUF2235 domain-containing protein n=1 Tax=Photobacterium sp. 53610 TaxID=3102789 RepID=UPI002ED97D2F
MAFDHKQPIRYVNARFQPLEDYSDINKQPAQILEKTEEPTADFECNVLIYCPSDQLSSLQTGFWTLKHSAEEKSIIQWETSSTPEGHAVLTAQCFQQEEKHLLHEGFQHAGSPKVFEIQPQPKGKGVMNAEFIPVKLAVQLDEYLGWATAGYFYHFVDNKLYQECKIIGEDRWSFYFTRSGATTLTDELVSEHRFSSLLLPYQVEGQPVTGQYILFRQKKLTDDEFKQISQDWLEEHAIAIDLESAIACRSQTLHERQCNVEEPSHAPIYHQVQLNKDTGEREQWPDIAQQYGLTAKQLLALNLDYHDNPLALKVGDSLLVTPATAYYQPDYPAPLTEFEPGKAYPLGDIWGVYQDNLMPWLKNIRESSQLFDRTPVINTFRIKKRVLRIGVFFDGTGQNKENDRYKETYGNKSRSNIGRLFDAYPEEPGKIAKIYVSGVGTVDGAFLEPSKIDDGKDEANIGQALGVSVFDTTGAFGKWQSLLQQLITIIRILETAQIYQEITHVEFDVFGFSRGAALARHFVNAALKGLPDYTRRRRGRDNLGILPNLLGKEDELIFTSREGYHLDTTRQTYVRFVGLFDTVGSFYWPGNDDEGNFDLTLKPDCAERVVQLCAHHEYRVNFPLTMLKSHGKLPKNFYEEIFPGAHSDVGGGYSSIQQYDKKGLDERYGFPIETTYNRVRIKSHSLVGMKIQTGNGTKTVSENPDSKLIPHLEFIRAEQELAWKQHCMTTYQKHGVVAREDSVLYYYALQPINNALSGLTQARMKQQAELAGINWDSRLEEPEDFAGDSNIQQLWQKLSAQPLGTIVPKHWAEEVSQFGHLWIHRPHDALINPGCVTFMEWLVSKPNRDAQDNIVREKFENS